MEAENKKRIGNHFAIEKGIPKNYWRLGSMLALLIFLYPIMLSLFSLTVVPTELGETKDLLPWGHESGLGGHRDASYKRDGDALFEHHFYIWSKLDSRKDANQVSTSHNRALESRIAMGYPLAGAYANAPGLAYQFASILQKMGKTGKVAAFHGINIGAGFWGAVCMVLLWLLGALWWRHNFNLLAFCGFSIAVNPLFFLSSQEPWLIAYCALLCIILAFSFGYKARPYFALACSFLGSLLLWYSHIFQFYLYIPMLLILGLPLLIKQSHRSMLLMIVGFILGALFLSETIGESLDFLSSSNKQLFFTTPIELRRYAGLLIGSVTEVPLEMAMAIGRNFGLGHANYWLFSNAVPFLGAPILIFGLLQAFKSLRGYALGVFLFFLLYWMGPVQYALSLTDIRVFAAESSIRMGYLLMPFLGYCSLVGLSNSESLRNKGTALAFAVVFLLNLSALIFSLLFLGKGNLSATVLAIHSLFMLIILRRGVSEHWLARLVIAFTVPILIAFSNTNGGTLYPQKISKAESGVFDRNEFNSSDVGLMVHSTKPNKLHPNLLYNFSSIRSLHAYRNPHNLEYARFFESSRLYLASPGVFFKKELTNLNLRNNWLGAFSWAEDSLYLKRLRRIIDLSAVSVLFAASSDSISAPFLSKRFSDGGLDAFDVQQPLSPIRSITHCTLEEANPISITEGVFRDSFDPDKHAIVSRMPGISLNPLQIDSFNFYASGEVEIFLNDTMSGLIYCNLVFGDALKAMGSNDTIELDLMRLNGCYTGIVIPASTQQHRKVKLEYR